ncbi:MAG: ATP-dependent Clp protease proteolytic subunit [Candidatus Aminicenantales bacterium]
MNLIPEYIQRNISPDALEKELLSLIKKYNAIRNTYLVVYTSSTGKQIPDNTINQEDYYLLHDLLRDVPHKKVDMYIETRGGSGESAEEIVKLLHDRFEKVSFVVSGEAKSAGTIIVLSGHEILMTETGSLGPIDAQMRIGRSISSAYDYMEWVNKKREEAEKQDHLNPFDSVMIAQITPGELEGVFNALEFAKELVIDWLVKYKFKDWHKTETRKIAVNDEMRKDRAKEIATVLSNHSKWRSHGRSIKLHDLVNDIGLKINRIEDDKSLAEIVYRIQNVCRFIFDMTATYKIFATEENKIFRTAAKSKAEPPQAVEIKHKCTKCGKITSIYAKLAPNPQIDVEFKKKGCIAFPKNAKLRCACGMDADLSDIKKQIESETNNKIIFEGGA